MDKCFHWNPLLVIFFKDAIKAKQRFSYTHFYKELFIKQKMLVAA